MPDQRRIFIFNPGDDNNSWWSDFARSYNIDVTVENDLQRAEISFVAQSPDALFLSYGPVELQFCSIVRSSIRGDLPFPIFFFSHRPLTREEKIEALRAGADEFIVMPSPDDLRRRLVPFLSGTLVSVPNVGSISRPLDLLLAPERAIKSINEQKDFLIALGLVLSAPLVASIGRVFYGTFDSWLGATALGMATNGIMWAVTSAAVYLALPFNGRSASFRQALVVAGFGWAPRLLGAFLGAIYAFLGSFVVTSPHFSAGFDLLPGFPTSSGASYLFNIGLFDVWCAWVTMTGVGTRYSFEKRWNSTTICVCVVCVIIGILVPY